MKAPRLRQSSAALALFFLSVLSAPGNTMLTIDSMPRILFTGDSQTCGRNLGIDFPQLLERQFPIRAINTAVGGSNSSALLQAMTGGDIRIAKGEHVLHGTKVRWGMGPFPGQGITIAGKRYTIDFIHEHPGTPNTEIHLLEPALEEYQGKDYSIDPGWEHRVARWQPDVVTLMYINDGAMVGSKCDDWREMIRRIRSMGAVPVLMSPIPVDGPQEGGNHPSFNLNAAKNAAAIRQLAETEKCWFIDVFNLTFSLDPALRTVIQDGIHPDTDGQTVIMDGLAWVFREMGLPAARPFIKGWQIETPSQALDSPETGIPLRTAQPDHPNPDRQLTEGFSIAAFRRWDEYGLLAKPDGHSLPFANSLLFHIGAGKKQTSTDLILKGTGIQQVQLVLDQQLLPLKLSSDKKGMQQAKLPAELAVGGDFRVVVEGRGDATLDWLAVQTKGPAEKWKAPDGQYREYRVVADHERPGNLVANPACQTETVWTLAEGAVFNRPFTRKIPSLSLLEDKSCRLVSLDECGKARAYDLLRITGSSLGNNGAFRLRQNRGKGKFLTRRRYGNAEKGLGATLEHNDGCPLVHGGSCLELPTILATAKQEITIPPNTKRLRISFFHRVWDEKRLGTRDVPTSPVRLHLAGDNFNRVINASPSFQWRKFAIEIPAPAGKVTLSLLGRADGQQLFTGIAIHPLD